MLTIIQHEQKFFFTQVIGQKVQRAAMRILAQIEDGREWTGRISAGSVTAASSASQTPSENSGRHCLPTCRLSRDFPTPPEPVRVTSRYGVRACLISLQLLFPPDEACHLCGQVMLEYIQCLDRREITGKRIDDQLVDTLRMEHILQAPLAHVAHGNALRHVLTNQIPGSLGKQYLPAVGGRHQALHMA